MAKPIVAVTMGDPAGVGPEIVLKALADPAIGRACRPIVFGDLDLLQRTRKKLRIGLQMAPWAPREAWPRAIAVRSLSSLSPSEARPGVPSRACGAAVYRYVTEAARAALAGSVDAIATAPLNKKVLHLAGHRYPGHTELFAEIAGAREVRMMLLGRRLKVVLVTVHLPLMRVAEALTARKIKATLELTDRALKHYFSLSRPRLAVAALNPHAGEEEIFGREEKEIILPAVAAAKKRGVRAFGPFPADSLFYLAARGDYDAVICMFHDQGLIPLKLLDFIGGVALTLGLPFVRTSVDHGTAYDIAGRNKADETSMKKAILLAARLARRKS
ncbi:MAG TPA: 4-hydroxythreonine-4-phosphate dehydrogenase PdxA [Verrucomicrobiae bacterium]|jgi:4-hydroxythreonine-4-phosphate dehydrogenase|nr:4-hydroxythreonine-4-phosphate dehydrogenase PdxA [Verrucomicrobiae bacterium]